MYEIDKINALVEQTLKQEELIGKVETLEESINSINKKINLYSDFVSKAELQLSETLLDEDREKLNYLKNCLEDFVNLLIEKKKELIEIQNEFRFTNEDDFEERLIYIKNLLQFNSISQRIKIIEYNSKKLAKHSESSELNVLLSAEGRKKKIFQADAEDYEKLVIQKKELNRKLKKQYPSIIRNYIKETDSKDQYIIPIKTVNVIEPTKKEENYDEFLNKNNSIYKNVTPERWLRTKRNFKSFIMEELHISNINVVNNLLRFYDEGLEYNLEFKLLLHSLGQSQDIIDYIVNRFDMGPKPKEVSDNLKIAFYDASIFDRELLEKNTIKEQEEPPKKQGKIISFIKKKVSEVDKKTIKKGLENVAIFLGVTILSTSTISYAAKKLPKFIDKLSSKSIVYETKNIEEPRVGEAYRYETFNNDNSNVVEEVAKLEPFDVFKETFTVNENASIFINMYDAYNNTNQINPYHKSDTQRKVKAIVLKTYNQLIYVTTQEEYNYYINSGAEPISVVGMIDDYTEGFYRIEDTTLLAKEKVR